MKRFICLSLALLILFSASACGDKSGYKNVDTGVTAAVDTSKENFYGYDHMIINGEGYVMIYNSSRNMQKAGKNVTLLSPFANFGEKNEYTLYEVKSDSGVNVYTDTRDKALFCKENELDAFNSFYDNYNNYTFSVSVDQSTTENVTFEKDLINVIASLAGDETKFETVSVKSTDIYRLLPVSCDGVVEKNYLYIAEYNSELYLYLPSYMDKGVNAVKIDSQTAEKISGILADAK